MARNVVDELVVRLTADATKLQAELGKAEAKANASGKRIGTSFATAFRQASQLGLAAVTGITAVSTALVTAANKAAAYADEIDKTAIRTRLSRGALQELAFAADQAGVPFTALEANIRAFTGRLAEAERGSATVAGTFDRLGVSLRDQSGALRDTEALFLDTIEALSGIENESTRAALAVQAFGEQGSALLPFLNLGAGGLDELRAKARELGLVLDDQAIGSLVAYKDQLSAFQQQFGAASREIATQFLPLLTEGLLPALESALRVFRNFPEPVQRGAAALSGLGVAAGAAAAAFRVLGVSLAPLFGPAGLIIAAAGVAATLAFALSGGNDSLTKAAEDGAKALAGGDAGSLSGAVGAVADELSGPLAEKLLAAQSELAETGRIGVQAAQDIERAFAAVLARQGLSRGLLGAFPTAAATGLDLASNPTLVGAAAVPGANAAVQARLALGDLEGALDVVNRSLDALTSNFRAVDQRVLTELANFRDRLAADIRGLPEAEFTPRPVGGGGGGGVRPPAAAGDGAVVLPDPAEEARAWTERLLAEVRFGIKSSDEAASLILPAFEKVTNAAQDALTGFGFDSQEYADALAKVDVLAAALDALGARSGSIPLPGVGRFDDGAIDVRATVAGRLAVAELDIAAAAETAGRAIDVTTAVAGRLAVSVLDIAAALEQANADAERAVAPIDVLTPVLDRIAVSVVDIASAARTASEAIDVTTEVSGRLAVAVVDIAAAAEQATAAIDVTTPVLDRLAVSVLDIAAAARDANAAINVVPTPFVGIRDLGPDFSSGFLQGVFGPGQQGFVTVDDGTDAAKNAAEVAESALKTKQAIITAGVQFAANLAGAIKSGSPSGIFGALTGGIGSIISAVPGGALAGTIFGVLGGLFAGLLPDGSRPSEAARAAGANVSGAPSISINLTQNVSLAVASLVGSEARAAFDRANSDLLRLIETNVLPRIGRLEAAT